MSIHSSQINIAKKALGEIPPQLWIRCFFHDDIQTVTTPLYWLVFFQRHRLKNANTAVEVTIRLIY